MPELLLTFIRVIVLAGGVTLVNAALLSIIRTFVLPRSVRDPVTRFVFDSVRFLIDLRLRFVRSFRHRDRVMALYAPISLMVLLFTWYITVMVGYALINWSAGIFNPEMALRISGSSLLTLGFEPPETFLQTLISFSEAIIGLLMVALLIAYLPTMYAAFSRREAAVTLMEVRAGSPPSAVEMLLRYHRIHGLERLGEVWENWEMWFADVGETHTSLTALVFFRSPQPHQSWVTASGTVLDAASLALSAVDIPEDPRANLCLSAGYTALQRIADFFGLEYDRNPGPDSPVSISREEFNQAVEEMARQGMPVKSDLDQAWKDFAGWRLNYDQAVSSLAKLTMAPKAIWINDNESQIED